MDLFEKTIKKNYIYRGRIISLRCDEAELQNGKTVTREVCEHPGGVAVLPLTDKNEVILVRQFRYPYMEILLEIPAGKLDHKAEIPLECGRRELLEETGMISSELIDLGCIYPSPGFCDEIIYLYLAKDLTVGAANPDEDEFLQIVKMPFPRLRDEIMKGNVRDAKTVAAVFKVSNLLNI